ncbi:MAG: Rrf2 family transcriptional regulator [Clostridia bacterium]|nr:Rrf2 family transcriptional regulator [Clostridia bacterium]
MKISASGEYAIRILVDIASGEGYVSLSDVAKREGISLKYSEKIVSKLLKNNLLESLRGQGGGYKLAKKPEETTIKEVLEITGDITPVIPCLDTECPHKNNCKSISVWQKLDGLINDYLKKVTIADLMK